MGRVAPTIEQVEEWFYLALDGAGRGLSYARAWKRFSEVAIYKERASKTYLRELREGIDQGRVKSISYYNGPEGRLYGRSEDPSFAQAKLDAERPPPVFREPTMALGGRYNESSWRMKWELCPVENRMMRVMILTVGIVDFMRCDLCDCMHALGVRPEFADRRPHAWELDPLFFKEDYADELSRRLCGQTESNIPRIRKGGRYQGLMYRANEWGNPEKWNEEMDRARVLRKNHSIRRKKSSTDIANDAVRSSPKSGSNALRRKS